MHAVADPDPRDLEFIVTCLQLAAIELTPEPGTEFTEKQLLDEAMALGGREVGLQEADAKIVLHYVKFLVRRPGGKFVLK